MNKFLDKFSFADLFKYAGLGGLAILAAGHLASNKFDDNVKKNEYYSQAVTLLSEHTGAKLTLGEPLTFGQIASSDKTFNKFEKTYVKLCVPVNGSKEDGNYYFWAVKHPKEDDKWVITRAELSFTSIPDKLLVIKS